MVQWNCLWDTNNGEKYTDEMIYFKCFVAFV